MKGLACKIFHKKMYFLCLALSLLLQFCFSASASALSAVSYSYYAAWGGNYSWANVAPSTEFRGANYIQKVEPHFDYNGAVSGNSGVIQDTIWLTTTACSSTDYLGRLINENSISVLQVVVNNTIQAMTSQSVRASTGPVHHYTDSGCPGGDAYYQSIHLDVAIQFRNTFSGNDPTIWYTVGSDTTAFYYNHYYNLPTQQPKNQFNGPGATVSFSDNISNALLETQVQQNNTIINELGDMTDAVNNPQWVQDQNQSTQDAYDDAQSDVETNTDLSNIANKTTSLINVLGSVLSAISNPQDTGCIIPVDLSRYPGGTSQNVDLCHLSPPSGITDVLNVIFVGMVVFALISFIRFIFNVFREATSN